MCRLLGLQRISIVDKLDYLKCFFFVSKHQTSIYRPTVRCSPQTYLGNYCRTICFWFYFVQPIRMEIYELSNQRLIVFTPNRTGSWSLPSLYISTPMTKTKRRSKLANLNVQNSLIELQNLQRLLDCMIKFSPYEKNYLQ